MFSDPTGHFVITATIASFVAVEVALVLIGLWMCSDSGQAVIQESADSIANAVDDTFAKINQLNDRHKGEYTVYALADAEGDIRYVGRTKNFERRMAEHRKNSKTEGLTPIMRIDGLTWSEARGLEQIGIVTYNTIDLGRNSINGISPKNINREAYLTAAWNYIYNQATNEWYNLLGK